MKEIIESNIRFHFPNELAIKYDDEIFYQKFKSIAQGTKAIDILYISNPIAWMIEVKNYQKRVINKQIIEPEQPSKLPEIIATKVRDTMAGICCLKYDNNNIDLQSFAENFLKQRKLKIVFHLEQDEAYERFRPIDPADILQRLKVLLRNVDPNPYIVNCTNLLEKFDISWSAEREN
ncbi:hypothetical protein E4T80_01875 [Muribacter muris]|uniref:NERD domain-containing protein n=1 Tax=Muribacter muris TaxID=67855 RepID=A0A4Y9K720_9PAST|nr:hypothetical protein [Muribacter muris]MBF0784226.1 hypothetical protein [Muribacter muris]MBF0827036.1 hypothetical protein [Muribacter muris]TFV12969.1 hypothetical protein E4T80_01875 [Muribacter muris]